MTIAFGHFETLSDKGIVLKIKNAKSLEVTNRLDVFRT